MVCFQRQQVLGCSHYSMVFKKPGFRAQRDLSLVLTLNTFVVLSKFL